MSKEFGLCRILRKDEPIDFSGIVVNNPTLNLQDYKSSEALVYLKYCEKVMRLIKQRRAQSA